MPTSNNKRPPNRKIYTAKNCLNLNRKKHTKPISSNKCLQTTTKDILFQPPKNCNNTVFVYFNTNYL